MSAQSIHNRPLRLDHLLRAWAVLWLLALPLFHIHPETDPHHGEAGHIHAAAVHTVFSADLEAEFGGHQDAHHHASGTESGPALSAETPHAWNPDPELSFSLLNDATDRKLVKPLFTHLLFVVRHFLPSPERRGQTVEQSDPTAAFPLLVSNIPVRAPPAPLVG
ncbi:MAG: hypothetical protein GDA66_17075 [Nitrospira sp. CR1.2]|nr:hypothetical protein [Nitrospira sp. CR1.2]